MIIKLKAMNIPNITLRLLINIYPLSLEKHLISYNFKVAKISLFNKELSIESRNIKIKYRDNLKVEISDRYSLKKLEYSAKILISKRKIGTKLQAKTKFRYINYIISFKKTNLNQKTSFCSSVGYSLKKLNISARSRVIFSKKIAFNFKISISIYNLKVEYIDFRKIKIKYKLSFLRFQLLNKNFQIKISI